MTHWHENDCALCGQHRKCAVEWIRGARFAFCQACVKSARTFTKDDSRDSATVAWALQRLGVIEKRGDTWEPTWTKTAKRT